MSPEKVADFYDVDPLYEWSRLDRHRTEFAVTLRAMDEYLPPSPARVLDAGGGPGRYAFELAQRGYAVTLFDLSAGLLDFARGKAAEIGITLADIVQGSATDLSAFAANSFDAVLLMGPLYHLLEAADRETAVREASRVLKPGGVILAAFITRYAPIRNLVAVDPASLAERRHVYERILETGRYIKGADDGFIDAYFAHPTDIPPLMAGAGFTQQGLIACEGVVSMIEAEVNQLTGEVWEQWVDLNYRLGKDPSIHGAVEHLLYVGQKTAG